MPEETQLQDIQDINALVQGWIWRDTFDWDRLAAIFHPDATVEITWFRGPATEFVEGSRKMGKSAFRSKHQIGFPTISFQGDRAISETSVIIHVEHADLALASSTYARFHDHVDRRDGAWKIARRDCIYDLSAFAFPRGVREIETALIDRFPPEYGSLAYLLTKADFPVDGVYPVRGSEMETTIRENGRAWLAGTAS